MTDTIKPQNVAGAVHEAMQRAFKLGQTYWQQADSDSYKQNAKSDETHKKFREVRDQATEAVRAALACADAAVAQERERCAKICESTYPEWGEDREIVQKPCFDTPAECAAAIRASKEPS